MHVGKVYKLAYESLENTKRLSWHRTCGKSGNSEMTRAKMTGQNMTLHAPFEISSRLMPAVKVGNDWISLATGQRNREGRTQYGYFIDTPAFEYHGTDLKSGCQGGGVQEGMTSLLSFLSAAAESYAFRMRTGIQGENEDLFPANVVEWAYQNRDEISMLECDLEESGELITD